MATHTLTPPPIMSTALVVPTREVIKGSLKIIDSTTLRALSDLIEAKIAFFISWSTSAECTAVQRRVSKKTLSSEKVMGIAWSAVRYTIPQNNPGVTGLASIFATRAAKRPIL